MYPEKFTGDNVVAPFTPTLFVTVTLPAAAGVGAAGVRRSDRVDGEGGASTIRWSHTAGGRSIRRHSGHQRRRQCPSSSGRTSRRRVQSVFRSVQRSVEPLQRQPFQQVNVNVNV